MRNRILIVDDDPAVSQSLRRVLQSEGYAVALASTGAEALQEFGQRPTDLVLLDLSIPIPNGWEVLERIKSINAAVPVILITAEPHQQAAAAAAEANALMEKPLDFPALLAAMASLIAAAQKPVVC